MFPAIPLNAGSTTTLWDWDMLGIEVDEEEVRVARGENGCESSVTPCCTDCLSYQPLSRIWCVISPLIMPLLRFNYFPFMFSQNVQEESIISNILHLSLSSNINSMYRCEAVLCNSYSAWTTWERNSRQLLFFARTSLSSCSLVLKLCE